MTEKQNPIRETTDEARELAKSLITNARFGSLGVLDGNRLPHVTRIALACVDHQPITLISELSTHTKFLNANPSCSLLVGEPANKGDPLTHPRITLSCKTEFIPHDHPEFQVLKPLYLAQNPKAKLYIDFADFHFARFNIQQADLNGGFGKAFQLTKSDLGL